MKQYIKIRFRECDFIVSLDLEPHEYVLIPKMLLRADDNKAELEIVECTEEVYNKVFYIKS
jgi:hypothetical protein